MIEAKLRVVAACGASVPEEMSRLMELSGYPEAVAGPTGSLTCPVSWKSNLISAGPSGQAPAFTAIEPAMEPVNANLPVAAAAAEDIHAGFATIAIMLHAASRYRAVFLSGKCIIGAPDISIVLAVFPVVVIGRGVLLLEPCRLVPAREDGAVACRAHRGYGGQCRHKAFIAQ